MASTAELAFLTIELRDRAGVLAPRADRRVEVEVSGAGVLQGLGTGRRELDRESQAIWVVWKWTGIAAWALPMSRSPSGCS
ncbi:hypothetical protein ACWD4G_37755 [Streptomyces sp. NPDC002643]